MNEPVIFVVDDDAQVLAAIRRDLRSRYREEYRVLAADSGESALDAVKELKAKGDTLALMISDQRMPSMLGVDLLVRCREIYPVARRVLLTAYSDMKATVRAINEVHLDHYLEKPWDPPEERLYPAIDELLSLWKDEYRPEFSGIRLIGYQWSSRSHAVKDFLASNLIPYRWLDVDRDPDASRLLLSSGAKANELPIVFLENGTALRNPDQQQLSEALGLTTAAKHDLYDLIIVGAGPAGLAAAVYGASEGMRTLLLDGHGPGGQAGSSSRIENYLGFPLGVSGPELTRRAVAQAERLGAEIIVPVSVAGLSVEGGYKHLNLSDGRKLIGRSVIAATGMMYREHPAEGISTFTGAGVYYGSASTEALSCRDAQVVIVGGGNSAGQCAVYLSRFARNVRIVVRRNSLEETMSDYLIDQIAAIPNIQLRFETTVERVHGEGHLQKIWLKSLKDDSVVAESADALFIFIGTRPHNDWLPPSILQDSKGFILTGQNLAHAEGFRAVWKETRDPMPLETSIAGVFAAGDLRAGAMNRVANAVGEGSMAVRLVYDYLSRT